MLNCVSIFWKMLHLVSNACQDRLQPWRRKVWKYNKWVILSLTFVSTSLCVSSACSKAERPPSLSLYPSGEGMVRGGLGGARMMPGKDIWQVSELGQSTFCSAYQVGQKTALSSSTTTTATWVAVGRGQPYCCPFLLATPTRTTSPPTPACVTFEETILFTSLGNLPFKVRFVR